MSCFVELPNEDERRLAVSCNDVRNRQHQDVQNEEDRCVDQCEGEVNDSNQYVVEPAYLALFIGQGKEWQKWQHEEVEGWTSCNQGAVELLVLVGRDDLDHSVIVEAQFLIRETLVRLRQDSDDEVDEQYHVEKNEEEVERLAELRSENEIVVNAEVPDSERRLKEHNHHIDKAVVFFYVTENQDARACEDEQLNAPEHQEDHHFPHHGVDNPDQRSEGLCQLEH